MNLNYNYSSIVRTECYGDTVFISTLLKSKVGHVMNNTKIANLFDNQRYEKLHFVAITDFDKPGKLPKKFLSYNEQKDYEHYDKIKYFSVFNKPSTRHYIIYLKPALEKFIFHCCSEIDFNKKKYPFLNSLDSLIRVTKDISVEEDNLFAQFLIELINSSPPTLIAFKKTLLDYISKTDHPT